MKQNLLPIPIDHVDPPPKIVEPRFTKLIDNKEISAVKLTSYLS